MNGESASKTAEVMRRWATLALPAASVAVAVLVLLGPGKPRAAIGARVWGAPVDSSRVLALRIEGVRRVYGVDDVAVLSGLSVEVRSASGEKLGVWAGDAGPSGIVEASVRLERDDAGGAVDVRVTQGERVLAEGRVNRRRAEAQERGAGVITGTERGDCRARVEAARGVMTAGFEEELRVVVEGGAPGGSGWSSIEATAVGAEIAPSRAVLDSNGRARFRAKALGYNVEVSLSASDGAGKSCVWEGYLPVIPGAIWLDPRGLPGELRLVSPAPREQAYLSVMGAEGRVFGAVVVLARDEVGYFVGRMGLPEGLLSAGVLDAVVAGDPYEQGAGTAVWPIAPPEGRAALRRVELLVEGMEAAEGREKERAASARRAGMLLVGAASLVEALLLLSRSRVERRRLSEHFAAAAEGAEERERLMGAAKKGRLLSVFIAVSLVGLAFALVMAFAALR